MWRPSSLATMVWPSGEKNASSAENAKPFGMLPATGNCHTIFLALSTTMRRPLPRSTIIRPFGNGQVAAAAGVPGAEPGVLAAGDVGLAPAPAAPPCEPVPLPTESTGVDAAADTGVPVVPSGEAISEPDPQADSKIDPAAATTAKRRRVGRRWRGGTLLRRSRRTGEANGGIGAASVCGMGPWWHVRANREGQEIPESDARPIRNAWGPRSSTVPLLTAALVLSGAVVASVEPSARAHCSDH